MHFDAGNPIRLESDDLIHTPSFIIYEIGFNIVAVPNVSKVHAITLHNYDALMNSSSQLTPNQARAQGLELHFITKLDQSLSNSNYEKLKL